MIKMIVFIILACIGLALGITYCSTPRQGTLTINPAADFPADKKKELGQSVARILPKCPGLGRYGEQLEFKSLSTDERGLTIVFDIPVKASLPAEWGRPDKPCSYLITTNYLDIEGDFCQTMCLGKAPEKAGERLVIELPEKK